jgi:hypothetical protein
MIRPATTRLAHSTVACIALMAAGCARSPSYDIMGSLFPAWLVCIVLGILFAVLARWLLLRARIAVLFPALVYPCLAAALTFALWLLFFQ